MISLPCGTLREILGAEIRMMRISDDELMDDVDVQPLIQLHGMHVWWDGKSNAQKHQQQLK